MHGAFAQTQPQRMVDLSDAQRDLRDFAASKRMSPFGLPIPRVALPVFVPGSSDLTGGYGVEVLLLTYQVRSNWFFLATGIVLGFTGNGQAPNPGDANYTIDVDCPLGEVTGYVEKNFGNVPFPIGSLTGGPLWPVEFRHHNGERIRIKGTPVANMGTGAANFLTAALVGWTWPEEGYEL